MFAVRVLDSDPETSGDLVPSTEVLVSGQPTRSNSLARSPARLTRRKERKLFYLEQPGSPAASGRLQSFSISLSGDRQKLTGSLFERVELSG